MSHSFRAALIALAVAVVSGCVSSPSDTTEESLLPGISNPLPQRPRKTILWSNLDGSAGRWHYVGPSTTMNTFNWGGAGWNLIAQGNFFGDGQQSLLWRNQLTASFGFWRMSGDTAVAATPSFSKPGWGVVAVRDFDNDGTDDIMWLDYMTTTLHTTLIANGAIKQDSLVRGWTPDSHKFVDAAGVLDGSNPFVVFRDSLTGDVTTMLVGAAGTVAWDTRLVGNAPLEWRIVAAADFDGDGKDDLLWHNDKDGSAVVWLMDGYVKRAGVRIGQVGLDWQLLDGGDVDGDGHADLLWRARSGGAVGVWFLNANLTVREYATLGSAPCEWRIVGLNIDDEPHCPPPPPSLGEACSTAVPCASGLTCLRGICRDPSQCGHAGEPCCGGGKACPGNGSIGDNQTLQCNAGMCEACGDLGLECCTLNTQYCPGHEVNDNNRLKCVNYKCTANTTTPASLVVTDWSGGGYLQAGTAVKIDWHICNFGSTSSAPTMTYATVIDDSQIVQYKAIPAPIGVLGPYPSSCADGGLIVPSSLPAGSYGVSVLVNGVPFTYGFTLD